MEMGLKDRAVRINPMISDWIDAALRWWYGATDKGTRVVRVIAFNIGDPDLGFVQYLAWNPENFAKYDWEDYVYQETGFKDARLEIRLVQNGKKRRVVLYPGDPCDPEFPPPPKHVIVNARLMPIKDSEASSMDVTRRVQKYVGNSLRCVSHMFPFDDHEDNVQRFSHVHVFDLGMKVTHLPLIREPCS
jgi:hypothetical protein